jgi:hypothetical protein
MKQKPLSTKGLDVFLKEKIIVDLSTKISLSFLARKQEKKLDSSSELKDKLLLCFGA